VELDHPGEHELLLADGLAGLLEVPQVEQEQPVEETGLLGLLERRYGYLDGALHLHDGRA
jgi:hypothetical protein